MMNNKGQTLVTFIVFLPLLLIIMATVIDIGLMYYEKNKLDNLNMMATEYGINHSTDTDLKDKINSLIIKNDNEVKIKKLDINDKDIKIVLTKQVKSIFGKIIGIEEYKITSKYIGDNNKKEIKKG